MCRAWTTVALVILSSGCQSGEKPVRGANRGVDPPLTHQSSANRPEPRFEIPTPEPRQPQTILVRTSQEKTERDLGAELRAALGMPIDCLRDFDAPNPTTIRINVRAIVRPTGVCIDPSAYGTGLSTAALDCIKRRIGALALRPLEDTAQSETASTVLEIKYEPPVTIETAQGTPEPELRNVRDPLPTPESLPLSGTPIQESPGNPPKGGEAKQRDIDDPEPRYPRGPKPRTTDGYEVDDNVEVWR